MIKRSDLALLVIAAATPRAIQPVQIQKALFLLGKNLPTDRLPVESPYEFRPYDYGPFSSTVYGDAEELAKDGLIEIGDSSWGRYKVYSATPAGADRARAIGESLTPEVRAYVQDLVKWVCSLSFRQLVREVYRLYPDMKVNSVFDEAAS